MRSAKRLKRNRIATVVVIGSRFWAEFGNTFYAAFNLFGHKIGKRAFKKQKQQAEYERLVVKDGGSARKFIPGNNWAKKASDEVAGSAAQTWEKNMKTYLDQAVEESKGKS